MKLQPDKERSKASARFSTPNFTPNVNMIFPVLITRFIHILWRAFSGKLRQHYHSSEMHVAANTVSWYASTSLATSYSELPSLGNGTA